MTIREECVSHTLFLCMMHEISIPYTIISSAARNLFRFPFPSSFAKPFRGSTVPAFPAIQCFPFLAVGHAPSYRQRKRSLDFARDDVAEAAFSQHILYTGRGLSIPHPTVISSAARNLPCTLLFLAPFAEGFQFYFVTHTTLYRCARKIEGFGRDDDTEAAFSQHILYTGRGLSIPPPYRHFERSEKSSLHSALSCSFRKRFPLFRCHTYDAIPVCKKDPSASLGMTIRE